MTDAPNGQVVTDEGKQPVVVPTTEKPVEVTAPPVAEDRPVEATGELPEGVKERTQLEFEKLKEHNRAMAEKLKTYENQGQKRGSAFDLFAPREQTVQNTVPQVFPPFAQQVAPNTQERVIAPITPDENGLVDINVLNQTIAQINSVAKKSEEASRKAIEESRRAEERISKYEHTDKTLKTYEKHPYLDPDRVDLYDEKFAELTKLEILRQMTEEGKQDYLEAANRVKKLYYDPTVKPQPVEDTKQKETVVKRDQINAMSTAEKGEKDTLEQEYLVRGTRQGNTDAIYQRLKRSGY